jgi:hypothetical protein
MPSTLKHLPAAELVSIICWVALSERALGFERPHDVLKSIPALIDAGTRARAALAINAKT